MDINEYRNVPGFKGTVQANYKGELRRVYKTVTRQIARYMRNGKLICKINKKEYIVARLVYSAFYGPIKDGYNVIHKNGVQTDAYISNLELLSKQQLGNRFGGNSKSMTVVKIDQNGEIVDFYKSARECARKNYMSYQTIIDRCNGKVKSAFAPDGYAYAWEDKEKSMREAIRKVEEEKLYMPKVTKIEFDF